MQASKKRENAAKKLSFHYSFLKFAVSKLHNKQVNGNVANDQLSAKSPFRSPKEKKRKTSLPPFCYRSLQTKI